MFVGDCANRLQLDQQPIINQQVCMVFAQHGIVLIIYRERVLLLDVQPQFSKPMSKRVLIHLLQMAMPMVNMNGIGSLTNHVTQFINSFHSLTFIFVPQENTENAKEDEDCLLNRFKLNLRVLCVLLRLKKRDRILQPGLSWIQMVIARVTGQRDRISLYPN